MQLVQTQKFKTVAARPFIFWIVAAISFFFNANFARSQVQPPQADVPPAVLADSRRNPSASQSRLEIFTFGQWSSDVDSQFDPNKPTLILTHGWQPGNLDKNGQLIHTDITEYWPNVTLALAHRVNAEGQTGDINLLGWNWMPTASTLQIDPLVQPPVTVPAFAVYTEALMLAKELKRLAPQAPIQLVGHSLGAKLAAVAALAAQTGENAITIDQVSLMDGPELNTSDFDLQNALRTVPVHLEYEIPQLMQKNTYTESYASAFGYCYSELGIQNLNINMKANTTVIPLLEQLVGAHHLPIFWYFGGKVSEIGTFAGTIDPTTGDVRNFFGAAWSRVLNRTQTTEQILAARAKMIEGNDPIIAPEGMQYALIDRAKHPYDLLETNCLRKPRDITDTFLPFTLQSSVEWTCNGQVEFDTSESPKAILTTSSASYLMGKLTVPAGNAVLSFTLHMDNPEPDDKFTIFFDDQLIFTFNGQACPAEGSVPIGPVELTPFAGQTGTLTFCYASSTSGKTVRLDELKISFWTYLPLYRLQTRKIIGNGIIYPQQHYYLQGSTVTLHAFPHSGFRLWSWIGTNDDTLHTNLNTVTVNKSRIVTARFQFDLFDPICTTGGLPIIILMGLGMTWLVPNEMSRNKNA